LPAISEALKQEPEGATGRTQVHEITIPIATHMREHVLDLIGMADVQAASGVERVLELAFDHPLMRDGNVHTSVLQRLTQGYRKHIDPFQIQEGISIQWAAQLVGKVAK